MVAVSWGLSIGIETALNHGRASLWLVSAPVLTLDFALSFGLLMLALRYGSLWIGAAMLAQSAQLGLHAFFIAGDGAERGLFATGSNLTSQLLLIALLSGTIVAWRRRVIDRRLRRFELPA